MIQKPSQSSITSTPNLKQPLQGVIKRYTKRILVTCRKYFSKRREQGLQPENWCRGFSLVETLVAITILLVVIVGPMAISSQSAKSTSFASEQVVAFFLAQEGAELIHKHRDDFFNKKFTAETAAVYTETPWQDFMSSSEYRDCLGNGCGIEFSQLDSEEIATVPCGADACPLYFDDRTESELRSRYTHTATPTTENSPYRRKVVLAPVAGSSNNEIRVVSTVYWRSGNLRDEQSVSVETYLFNTYGQ